MLENSVWRHRDLRLAAAGRSASFLGDEVATIALTLYAFDAGWGATGVAAVLVAAALPLALGAPLAGRVVDRVDSRRATSLAALWQGLCALGAIVVLLLGDPASPVTAAALLALVAALGAGQAVSGPAWQALVPHLVPADEVPRAVALLQSTTTLAGVAGPAVGGLLVAGGGVAGALAVDAVSFGALAVAARAVRTVRRPERGAGGGGTWAGYALLRDDRVLGTLVAGLVAMIVVLQVVVVLDVLLVRDVLGAGPAGYGVVNALFAAAMVVGALGAGRWCAPRVQVGVVVGSVAAIAGLVVLGGLAPSLGWFAVVLAGIGLGNGALNVAFGAFLAGRVPDAVRGRVFAAVTGATQAASIGGMAVGGVVGGLVDVRTAWVAAGGAGLGVSAAVAAVVAASVRSAHRVGVTGGAGVVTDAMTLESRSTARTDRPAPGPVGTGAPARGQEQRLAVS